MHNTNHPYNKSQKYLKHMKACYTNNTTAVSKSYATIQYHICLHNITGEERVRRNVGEIATDSRDPGKK